MPSKNRQFVVTEIKRTAQGRYEDTKIQFIWDRDNRAAPRPSWRYGLKLHTVRDDNPGSDTPTEQVLTVPFKPFRVQGVWDDRYGGAGFAESTRTRFEEMVRRANLCRFQFEGISVVGLIVDVDIEYRRRNYVLYNFEVSPHFRNEGGDVRAQPLLAPQGVNNPLDYAKLVRQIVNDGVSIHSVAPVQQLVGTMARDVGSTLAACRAKADEIDAVIAGRVLGITGTPAAQALTPASRLVQCFSAMRALGTQLNQQLRTVSSSTGLAYETALLTLQYEVWARKLSVQAKLLTLNADAASRALRERIDSKAMALYFPYSGESLYGISLRFYQTPNRWREILAANGIHYFTMQGGEALLIPGASS